MSLSESSSSHESRPALRSVDHIVDAQYLGESRAPEPSQLADRLRVVLRYRWSILAIALVTSAIGILWALSSVPTYRAEARVLVKFNQPNVTNLQQFESTPLHWLYFETQAEIIRSRMVGTRVLERLRAAGTHEPAVSPNAVRESLSTLLGALIPDWRSWIPGEWRGAPEPLAATTLEADEVGALMAGLVVTGGTDSEVLSLAYVSADPAHAARVANAFAETYIEFGLESRTSNVQRTTAWLGERIDELRSKLNLSEAALREFQAREGMVDTRNREGIISSKLGTLSAELIRAQSRRSDVEARYRQVDELIKSDANPDTLAALVDSAIVIESHGLRRDAGRRLTELSERYGDKHPKMVAAKADLAEARRRFEVEVGKAAGKMRRDYELALSQERELKRVIDAQQSEMRRLSGKAFELGKLEREVDANRKLYDSFLARFKEADMADDYDVPQARVIDLARTPAVPFRPDKRRIVLVALALGLSLGIAMAFLREHLDQTFVSREQTEQILGLPVLGQLPHLRGAAAGARGPECAVLDAPRSPFAERINDVRTAIAFADVDAPPRSVLVSSAIPGEGKTTLAVNLALALRQRGSTVLVDADLRKGRLQGIFALDDGPGLVELLAGRCQPSAAVIALDGVNGLSLLPSGTPPPNPLEVLSSKRFEQTMRALRKAFDYVVVDGPPLLPVSDSIVLGHQVECLVLAVKADSTPHDAAREAVQRLQSARIRPAGVVLQQVDLARSRGYSRRYASAYASYYEQQPQRETG